MKKGLNGFDRKLLVKIMCSYKICKYIQKVQVILNLYQNHLEQVAVEEEAAAKPCCNHVTDFELCSYQKKNIKLGRTTLYKTSNQNNFIITLLNKLQ